MLTLTIFLPVATAAVVLVLPARRPGLIRAVALAGATITAVLTVILAIGFEPAAGLAWRDSATWIPAIGASYDVALTGISLPLVVMASVLFVAALVYAIGRAGDSKAHAALFLLMETGLLGVFSAQDLLLFYVFFEIGLVPMYFIIGLFGHEERGYAALKFFLYTRLGSLAMLLGILGVYLAMDPHSFSLPAIAAARPLAAGGPLAVFVFFALLLGFAIKVPAVPVHNWLPDAHVQAPAEGSAILAGVQLKMGGYGLVYIVLQTVPDQAVRFAWVLVALAVASLLYGAFAALGQRDLKRLVAFTSVNHMGYVVLGVAIWALSGDGAVRSLAITGATYQMVSHGLLTGAMFLMVGALSEQGRTRQMSFYGGLFAHTPIYAGLFALLAFGSLGIPGMSGFVAEFQVIGAAVSVSAVVALLTVLSLLVTTGLYLRVVARLLMGEAPRDMPAVSEPPWRRLAAPGALAACSVLLGIFPGPLVAVIASATRMLGS